MKNYFKSLFEEQPEERFFSLKLTKVVLWSFGIAFAVTFMISLNESIALKPSFTSDGVNYLVFELFKAPVAVAGFALPILGLIGLNHRSEQTKKQISATGEQNRFANYFKHLEEFKKHVEGLEVRKQIDMTNIRMIHDNLFSRAYAFGDYNIDSEELEIVHDFLIAADKDMKRANSESYFANLPEELSYLFSAQSLFGMKNVIRQDIANFSSLDRTQKIKINKDFILDLVEFAKVLRSIIAFSNSAVWDGRLGVLANSITLNYEVAEREIARKFKLNLRRQELAETIKEVDIK
ncbi:MULTISPECIES: hypothetical protein [Vibrio]|uniref:hypothetical protein n=1 Tax=Vibrio TaxID=662 RepID=UPI00111D3ACB|nr:MULTISPECIES: hypothetical protein [Vibrio]MCA2465995.1 hypothetical protein [Vibrio alginolyticus]MDW1564515.1 hypothetical protein [Vibrio sp. YT-15]MDW2194873.1 hypothetical protein [Vibrio sp. 2084]TOE82558.1 hypothetical protein CGJ34_15715 [Vibrio parahaemolyticus]